MEEKKILGKLAEYIKKPQLVQASGGNISCKINNEIMRIKASGRKIQDINYKKGYVDVNFVKIRNLILKPKKSKIDLEDFKILKNQKIKFQ